MGRLQEHPGPNYYRRPSPARGAAPLKRVKKAAKEASTSTPAVPPPPVKPVTKSVVYRLDDEEMFTKLGASLEVGALSTSKGHPAESMKTGRH